MSVLAAVNIGLALTEIAIRTLEASAKINAAVAQAEESGGEIPESVIQEAVAASKSALATWEALAPEQGV